MYVATYVLSVLHVKLIDATLGTTHVRIIDGDE